MPYMYLANQADVRASLNVQRAAAAGAVNGTAVDIADFTGPLTVTVDAPVASAGDTIDFTVEHSESSTAGFSAVPAAALVDPDTGAAATFTQVTDAVAVFETLALKREVLRRYVRVVATVAGAAPDVTFAAYVAGSRSSY